MSAIVPLKYLVDSVRPITYGIVQAGPDCPGGVPYIRPADMSTYSGVRNFENLKRTTPEIAHTYRRSTVTQGDIVVSIGPSYGKVLIVPEVLTGANLTQGTARIAPSNKAEARFLYWALQSELAIQFWGASAGGATFRALNLEPLGQTPVPLCTRAEQRRIADFLDAETARIDRLAATRTAQIKLLETREKVAAADAFKSCTSARRLRLKYLLSCKPRYGVLVPIFTEDGVPFIRVNDLMDLAGRAEALAKIPYELSEQYRRTITHSGDLLLSVVGTIGRTAVVPPELVGANVARAVASLRPSPGIDPHLLAAWMSTPEFHRQATDATGSDTAQPTLGMEDLGNFSLHWPLDEQELAELSSKLLEVKKTHTTLRLLLIRQRELLAKRRQALITAAVTGQFDVSTASGRGVTE